MLRLGQSRLQPLDVRMRGRQWFFQENYLFIHTHHLSFQVASV
jgi:hypothetical protein